MGLPMDRGGLASGVGIKPAQTIGCQVFAIRYNERLSGVARSMAWTRF